VPVVTLLTKLLSSKDKLAPEPPVKHPKKLSSQCSPQLPAFNLAPFARTQKSPFALCLLHDKTMILIDF
jgi:hypothetical protein